MSKEGKTGVTANTPERILFGAGTIHKGLKYANGAWNFAETIVCATQGGSELAIVPEVYRIEADGASVAVKGLDKKNGEKATLKIKALEIPADVLKAALLAKTGTSEDSNYDLYESKADIVEGDYFENIAFVGKTLKGKNIIAILDNALCISGFTLGGENKKETVPELEFECYADLASDLDTLPWHIYYPKETA